jgi:hypothetical protein
MNRLVWLSLSALFLWYGCSAPPPPPDTPAEEVFPEQELFRAKISFYSEDHLATVIDAGHVLQFEKQSLIILDSGIVADFFDDEFGVPAFNADLGGLGDGFVRVRGI